MSPGHLLVDCFVQEKCYWFLHRHRLYLLYCTWVNSLPGYDYTKTGLCNFLMKGSVSFNFINYSLIITYYHFHCNKKYLLKLCIHNKTLWAMMATVPWVKSWFKIKIIQHLLIKNTSRVKRLKRYFEHL